jgi:hypothetical protein
MTVFTDPAFSFPDTILITGADRKSIENWMTHGHITPSGGDSGRKRRFSLENHLTIALLQRLRETFNVQAATAAFIAVEATRDYVPMAEADMLDIWAGGDIGATTYRPTYSLTRDENGVLRAAERDDVKLDDVMLVLPVGLIARALFAKAKLIMDAAKAG